MDFQSVKSLTIPEGEVKTIHDKDNNLLWGAVGYGVKYAGNITQQSYSGFQLLKKNGLATDKTDTSFWENISSELTITPLGNGWARITASSNTSDKLARILRTGGFEWEASTTYTVILEVKNAPNNGAFSMAQPQNASDPFSSVDGDPLARFNGSDYIRVFSGVTKSDLKTTGLRAYFYGSFSNTSVDLRMSIVAGDHVSDYQNYCGNNWQPYVGGTTSPNPDYPQNVNVVTGRQVVTVSDGGSQSQEYEVNLGKNLFNKDNYSSLPGYFESNKVITNGVSNRNIIFYLPCKPNTVYSLQRMSSSGSNCLVGTTTQLPAYGVTVDNVMTWSAMTNGYTTGSTAQYLCLRYQTATSTTSISSILNDLVSSIQIEQNSTATSYAPYFTPIELCKTGDYQDYIYKSGDNWWVHKETGEYTFAGSASEPWTTGNEYTNTTDYRINDSAFLGAKATGANSALAFMNDFSGNIAGATIDKECFWFNGSGQIRIRINKSHLSVVSPDGFRTWLSANETSIYYPLATATDTQITNTALVGQLEAIHKWLTRYGYNATVSGNIPLIVDRTNL